MACFDTGNAAPAAIPTLLFTIANPSELSVSFVADTAAVVYIGTNNQGSPLSTSTGFLVGTVPAQFDCKPEKGTQLWAVGNGTAKIHWIFGA